MNILVIDDERDFPFANLQARTFEEGLKALTDFKWDKLYLDHDLGDAKGRTGYDIVKFLELNPDYRPGEVVIVTANPVGRKNIEAGLRAMGFERIAQSIWRNTEEVLYF